MKLSKTTALPWVLFFISFGSRAFAMDFAGVDVSGEASFDYQFLSSGDNTYPGGNGAKNEAYRLQQAQVVFKKETDQVSFLSRLNYAPTEVTTAAGSVTNTFGTLDQLEIFYKWRPELQIGFGRLSTTLGFESLMRNENFLYTNSVAYQSLEPGYYEGLRLKYIPNDLFNIAVSTYNRGTNNQFADDYNATKTTEAGATATLGNWTLFAGYFWGTDATTTTPALKTDKTATNAWVTFKANENLTMSVTYDSRSQKPENADRQFAQAYSGLVSYTMGQHTVSARYESILGAGDLDAINATTNTYYPGANKVTVITVGDKIKLNDTFNLHLEYRADHADAEVLKKRDGTLTNDGSLVMAGLVAHF